MPGAWTIPPWKGARRILARRARPLTGAELGRRTLILAPHPDDEVLGCGGLILRMRRLGTPVSIVYLTDGEASHARFIDPIRLGATRRHEAVEGAAVLGVPAEGLTFLKFPDGSLGAHETPLAARLAAVLDRHEPEQVFLPSRLEPTRDHQAAHRAARRALATRRNVCSYEYPIWAWRHWPWIGLPMELPADILTQTATGAGGLRLLADLRCRLPIGDLLEVKREALDRHRSQMLRPDGHEAWPILPEVAGGSFLSCFFRQAEFFRGGPGGPGQEAPWA